MTKLSFARRIASILVIGHLLLFIYGLIVAGLGRLFASDVAQMVLMGTPLLALISISGFQYVVANMEVIDNSEKLPDSTGPNLIIFVCILFLLSLFFVYSLALFDYSNISVDILKISVGVIETALGGYLAIIKDNIFVNVEGGSA